MLPLKVRDWGFFDTEFVLLNLFEVGVLMLMLTKVLLKTIKWSNKWTFTKVKSFKCIQLKADERMVATAD